jgi:hypothetical protein
MCVCLCVRVICINSNVSSLSEGGGARKQSHRRLVDPSLPQSDTQSAAIDPVQQQQHPQTAMVIVTREDPSGGADQLQSRAHRTMSMESDDMLGMVELEPGVPPVAAPQKRPVRKPPQMRPLSERRRARKLMLSARYDSAKAAAKSAGQGEISAADAAAAKQIAEVMNDDVTDLVRFV